MQFVTCLTNITSHFQNICSFFLLFDFSAASVYCSRVIFLSELVWIITCGFLIRWAYFSQQWILFNSMSALESPEVIKNILKISHKNVKPFLTGQIKWILRMVMTSITYAVIGMLPLIFFIILPLLDLIQKTYSKW